MIVAMFSDIRAQWELIENNTDYQFYSVFFTNDSTGFITGYISPFNVVRKTTDYGNTWTTVYQEEANYFYDVYFPSDSVGYVSTYGNMLKTTDSGNTWFYVNDPNDWTQYRSIVFQDNEVGFGCFADGGAEFATTIDGGVTWTHDFTYGGRELLKLGDCEIRIISGQYGKSDDCWDTYETSYVDLNNRSKENFAMLNNTSVLACGIGTNQITWQNFGFIVKSTDDGQSWTIKDFESTYFLKSIVNVNESTAYCVGQANSPYPHSFLKTTDAGETWYYQEYELMCDICTSPEIRDIYCPSENVCYAVRGFGGIWRTLNGGGELFPLPVSVAENEPEDELLLFPVPTNGLLQLNFPPVHDRMANIQVFDSMGQLVFTTNLNSADAEIDVSHLAPGCYSLRANFESTVLTRSFIKN